MNIKPISMELQKVCKKVSPKSIFGRRAKKDIEKRFGNFDTYPSSEMFLWYETAAPISVSIKWFGSPLILLDPFYLVDAQTDYRWINGSTRETWDKNWLVFAILDFDAFFVDTEKEGSPVYMVQAELDEWEPLQVADSLSSYLTFLIEWCKFLGEYKNFLEIYDDNFNVLPESLERIKSTVRNTLGDIYLDNFGKFTPI